MSGVLSCLWCASVRQNFPARRRPVRTYSRCGRTAPFQSQSGGLSALFVRLLLPWYELHNLCQSFNLCQSLETTVIVGSQWGDEGKGKLVDRLSADFDIANFCFSFIIYLLIIITIFLFIITN